MGAAAPWGNSGTAPVAPSSLLVDVRNPDNGVLAGAIAIRNTGSTNNLQVSFDGGRVFVPTIVPGQSFSTRKTSLDVIYVRAIGDVTTFEFVAQDQYD